MDIETIITYFSWNKYRLYTSKSSSTKSFIQKNFNFGKKRISTTDEYIIEYAKQQNHKKVDDSIRNRRIVFVSLIGLYQTWENVPAHILYTSIVILPFKQNWLNHPSQHQNDIKAHFASQVSAFHAGKSHYPIFQCYLEIFTKHQQE